MKKILFLLLFSPLFIMAQQGTLKESLELKSQILGKTVKYNVYFPADYDSSSRRYPVLYLLHGYTDNETAWVQFGEAQRIADRMANSDEVSPMLIVMPDAGVSWYINSFDGKTKYEDFFVQELIPAIDANYRTRAEKAYRGIAGLSMGGYGTLIMAMKHPDLFVAAAPLSAAVWTNQDMINMPDSRWKGLYGNDEKGEARLQAPHWVQNNPIRLAASVSADALKSVRYYIDCGDDDFLIKGNMELHAALIDAKIPHEFRVRDGSHNWTYWRTALPEVLKFMSASFRR
jgi:S-formylglutathione hydrolase FrmB